MSSSENKVINTKKQRIVWIDQLRAIAFFFVILGHVQLQLPENGFVDTAFLKTLIYSFHMPLFFLLSGMTFNTKKVLKLKDLSAQIFNYVKRLLIPYFWMSFTLFPLWVFTFKYIQDNGSHLKDVFIGIFVSNALMKPMSSGALWFLTDLFLAMVLFSLITYVTRSNRLLMLPIMILAGAVGYMLRGIDFPLHINSVCTSLVFIYIGNVFMVAYKSGKIDKLLKFNFVGVALFLISLVAWFVICCFNGRVSMVANTYGKGLDSVSLFYLGALTGSWCLLYIANRLPRIKVLTYLGRNTMLYMGIHTPIIRLFEFYCKDLMKNLYFLIIFSIVLYFAMIPFSALCNKFFPYIAGAKADISNYKQYERVLYKLGKYLSVFMSVLVPFYIFFRHFFGFESTLSVIVYILVTVLLTVVITLFTDKFLPFIYLEEYKGKRKLANSI